MAGLKLEYTQYIFGSPEEPRVEGALMKSQKATYNFVGSGHNLSPIRRSLDPQTKQVVCTVRRYVNPSFQTGNKPHQIFAEHIRTGRC